MELAPTILNSGLNAIWSINSTGLSAEISHIALGDAGYTPNPNQIGLSSEKARYPIAGGSKVSPTQIHVSTLADGSQAFWVKEVAFYLSNGVCFAIWSNPTTPLAYKSADTPLLLAYDLMLSALPPDSVTITSSAPDLNLSFAGELAVMATAIINLQLNSIQPLLTQ